MEKLLMYIGLAVIALAIALPLAAKTMDYAIHDPGLIKLTKSQRLAAGLMCNDGGNYAERIATLNAQLVDFMGQAETLTNTALADKRELTPDEATLHNGLMDNFAKIKDEVKRLEMMQDNAAFLRTPANPAVAPAPNAIDPQNTNGVIQHPHQGRQGGGGDGSGRIDVVENRGSNGFRHFGEFANAVLTASNKSVAPSQYDPRLMINAPTTFSQESVGADGGFLVPTEYKDIIMKKVMGEDSLLSRCDQFNTGSNSITVPQDTTEPWGTSGIQANWEGEASQLTQTKPIFKQTQSRLNKLTALVPVTEEMLEDSALIGSYLNSKAPEVMGFKINDAIVNGTGAGMPMGFMNSGSLITVAKETSQVADTVVAENVNKMWSRMYAPYRGDAIWLINQDVEPSLDDMSVKVKNVAGAENVGGLPVYMPAGGLADAPYGRLKGRPVMPIQSMQTLGDLGDIALVSLKQYMAAVKASGITSEVSMHLWFDYDMACFKFRFRMAGKPWFDSTISPKNGSNTLSPFVTLAARA